MGYLYTNIVYNTTNISVGKIKNISQKRLFLPLYHSALHNRHYQGQNRLFLIFPQDLF